MLRLAPAVQRPAVPSPSQSALRGPLLPRGRAQASRANALPSVVLHALALRSWLCLGSAMPSFAPAAHVNALPSLMPCLAYQCSALATPCDAIRSKLSRDQALPSPADAEPSMLRRREAYPSIADAKRPMLRRRHAKPCQTVFCPCHKVHCPRAVRPWGASVGNALASPCYALP